MTAGSSGGRRQGPALRVWRLTVALARLLRLHACAGAGIASLTGAWLVRIDPLSAPALVGALAVASITGAGNILNDVQDIAIDRSNRSDRPLVTGAIGVPAARVLAGLCFLAGLGLAMSLSVWCAGVALLNSGLLVFYAYRSKALHVGKNLLVAGLVGSVFVFSAIDPARLGIESLVLAACAALATFAREVVKDVEDLAGDAAAGAQTLPIALGARRAQTLAYSALALAIGIALLPWFRGLMTATGLALVLAGALVFALSFRPRSARGRQRLIMAGSLLELLAFMLGCGASPAAG